MRYAKSNALFAPSALLIKYGFGFELISKNVLICTCYAPLHGLGACYRSWYAP
ncbi:hypothetical protein [Moraxella lacunata]|uniref:hypothetical protein n=1 Tax=Moraxella lacunata TaxID=477 RepID=UPI000AB74B02|nr:hypothetical protein [Moraxella lacunata]